MSVLVNDVVWWRRREEKVMVSELEKGLEGGVCVWSKRGR
jgi:hypothetical protein